MADPAPDPLLARERALLAALRAGPLAVRELANAAGLPRPLVGITAHRLLELGYLTAQRRAADGASVVRRVYALSPEGERILQ